MRCKPGVMGYKMAEQMLVASDRSFSEAWNTWGNDFRQSVHPFTENSALAWVFA